MNTEETTVTVAEESPVAAEAAPAAETKQNRQKLQRLEKEMRRRLVGRNREIRGILAAAVAGQHVCLLGDPGTGKSMMARMFASGLGFSPEERGDYFELLMAKDTKDVEVLGAWRLEEVKQDRWNRKVEGKLPGAKIAFLDEVWKANSAILNGLLTLTNEGLLHQDSGAVKSPLRILIGASNETPDENENLAALWDRFTVRYWVTSVTSSLSGYRALRNITRQGLPDIQAVLSVEDLDAARKMAATVVIPEGIDNAVFSIASELRSSGIPVSDRKLVKLDALLRAHAYISGRDKVEPKDLRLLEDVLWETPDQKPKVEEVVAKFATDPMEKLMGSVFPLLKALDDAETALDSGSQPTAEVRATITRINGELKVAAGLVPEGTQGEAVDALNAAITRTQKLYQRTFSL